MYRNRLSDPRASVAPWDALLSQHRSRLKKLFAQVLFLPKYPAEMMVRCLVKCTSLTKTTSIYRGHSGQNVSLGSVTILWQKGRYAYWLLAQNAPNSRYVESSGSRAAVLDNTDMCWTVMAVTAESSTQWHILFIVKKDSSLHSGEMFAFVFFFWFF